jgi:hypothetical protein
MALQPATRRLLTEATAATTYQPKGTYQPAGSYLTTAQRGVANGVASLGPDGLVPSAQLPAASSTARGVVVSALSTATSVSLVSGAAEFTMLRLAATLDPTRTYEIAYDGLYNGGGGSQVLDVRALAGATAPNTGTGTRVMTTMAATGATATVRARFCVNTAGTYTVALFNLSSGNWTNGWSSAPVAVPATLFDCGPKVANLLTVP